MRPKRIDKDLPSCVYRKHGAIYLVSKGKWIRLGKTVPQALLALSKRMDTSDEKMPGLLQRWLDTADISENTRKGYKTAVKRLSHHFNDFFPHQVTAHNVMAVMAHYKKTPGSANILRSVLLGSLDLAFEEMRVERNVVKDVSSVTIKARDRLLTSEEYERIYTHASPLLKAIMTLLYLTGQRISDILDIRLQNITEQGIFVKQIKTKNNLIIGWSDELRDAVEEAKKLNPVRGMYLFHRGGHKLSYVSVRKLWDKAREKAGVKDAQMRDIRAKSGTDARDQGLDSQKLLGHKSSRTHQIYLRSKEVPVATPVSNRQSVKKTG